jgi:hypothetical protein
LLTSTISNFALNCNAIMLIGGLALLAVAFSSAGVTGEIRGVVQDFEGR